MEHKLVDGICEVCEELDRARHVRTAAGAKKYGLPIGAVIGGGRDHVPSVPHVQHVPAAPKAAPRAGRQPALKDRLVASLKAHRDGHGQADPFDGYDREQLRRVAKAHDIPLERGESRESIGKKLLDRVAGPAHREPKPPPPPPPAAGSARKRGADISGDFDYASLPPKFDPNTSENGALKAIVKKQGFDGLPRVVSEADFDAALRAGEVRETWRGLASPYRGPDARVLAEQYRSGDFHVGVGINGDGSYVAMNKADGQYYGSTLLRIGLRKDAKVISADALDAEMDAYFASRPARRRSEELRALDEKLLRDLARAKSPRARANIRRKYRNDIDGLDPDKSIDMQRDPGMFAALRGYDAIEIPKTRSPDKHHEMIVLNRAATIVQEA